MGVVEVEEGIGVIFLKSVPYHSLILFIAFSFRLFYILHSSMHYTLGLNTGHDALLGIRTRSK